MANWLMASGDLLCINMDHVSEVERGTIPDQDVLKMDDGRSIVVDGDQAERVREWLIKHCELPVVYPRPGGQD